MENLLVKYLKYTFVNAIQFIRILEHCSIRKVQLNVDYKPKALNFTSLQQGNYGELINLIHLEDAELSLPAIILTGLRGWPQLADGLIQTWMPQITSNQLSSVLNGITPIHALVEVGSGLADLVLLPFEQYKKNGNVLRGIRKGIQSFATKTTHEALKVGARLAIGTQTLLEHADDVFNKEIGATSRSSVSKFSESPQNTSQGTKL